MCEFPVAYSLPHCRQHFSFSARESINAGLVDIYGAEVALVARSTMRRVTSGVTMAAPSAVARTALMSATEAASLRRKPRAPTLSP